VAYKFTMLFHYSTEPLGGAAAIRTAGWSESVYNPGLGPNSYASFQRLARARAGLLPQRASIIGYRIQQVMPVGGSSTGAWNFPGTVYPTGTILASGDVPQACLLCRTRTSDQNIRPTLLRCFPDFWIRGGELFPSTGQTDALAAYFAQLTGWSMLGRDLSAEQWPVFAVSETGLLSFTAAHTVTVPGLLRVSGSIGEWGNRFSGTFKALSQPTTSSVQLEGWNFGATTGGKAYVVTPSLHTLTTTEVSRIIVKKVGRPFFAYRGRRSNRLLAN